MFESTAFLINCIFVVKFKAANFMPMSLINAFHAVIYINQRHIDDAVALFEESNVP